MSILTKKTTSVSPRLALLGSLEDPETSICELLKAQTELRAAGYTLYTPVSPSLLTKEGKLEEFIEIEDLYADARRWLITCSGIATLGPVNEPLRELLSTTNARHIPTQRCGTVKDWLTNPELRASISSLPVSTDARYSLPFDAQGNRFIGVNE